MPKFILKPPWFYVFSKAAQKLLNERSRMGVSYPEQDLRKDKKNKKEDVVQL